MLPSRPLQGLHQGLDVVVVQLSVALLQNGHCNGTADDARKNDPNDKQREEFDKTWVKGQPDTARSVQKGRPHASVICSYLFSVNSLLAP